MAKEESKAVKANPKGTDPRGNQPTPNVTQGDPQGKVPGAVEASTDDEEQIEVEVVTAFHLQDDSGTFHEYSPGPQRMPKSHATHWYAKAHGVKPKKAKREQAEE